MGRCKHAARTTIIPYLAFETRAYEHALAAFGLLLIMWPGAMKQAVLAREGDRRSCRPKNERLATYPQACETYLHQDPVSHHEPFARPEEGVRSSGLPLTTVWDPRGTEGIAVV